jgi:hypothetical protein
MAQTTLHAPHPQATPSRRSRCSRHGGLAAARNWSKEAMRTVFSRRSGSTIRPAVLALAGGLAVVAASDAGATNLIVNGGFELGISGFASDYTQWTPAYNDPDWQKWVGADQYTVWSNAAEVHGNFIGTAQSGAQFFIANGGDDTSKAVWQSQAFSVTQVGVSYRFEAYVSSLVSPGEIFGSPIVPPSLVFEISSDNGSSWTGLGSTVDLTGALAGVWFLSYADTTLNQAGSYMVRLRNNQTGFYGNDFGLDSLYFGLAGSAPSAVPGAGMAGLATLGLAGLARRRRR